MVQQAIAFRELGSRICCAILRNFHRLLYFHRLHLQMLTKLLRFGVDVRPSILLQSATMALTICVTVQLFLWTAKRFCRSF